MAYSGATWAQSDSCSPRRVVLTERDEGASEVGMGDVVVGDDGEGVTEEGHAVLPIGDLADDQHEAGDERGDRAGDELGGGARPRRSAGAPHATRMKNPIRGR